MTFPTTVIRKLARSEEGFAQTKTFHGVTLSLAGPVDADAMSVAFDTLLQAHPVLAGHLELGPDGRHQIVTDDLLHPGIWVVEDDDGPSPGSGGMRLDQRVTLVNLLLKTGARQSELTLFSHHSMADGSHQFSLIAELFSWYTGAVCTGSVGPVTAQPAPQPVEAVLHERGIPKQQRSGLERFMPAMFAYELPAGGRKSVGANPDLPSPMPVARCSLTQPETRALAGFCRDRRLSLNAVVAAAILLGEWRVRDTPNIPIPYLYPVDLRFLLTPPVTGTGCTNAVGLAAYLAEIDPETDAVDLARDISETFRADLSEGVIQQSLLHFNPEEVDLGLPTIVLCTDMGTMPDLPTPPGLEVEGFRTEVHRASLGVDLYGVGMFKDRLGIELHTQANQPQRSIDTIHSLLCAVPMDDSWMAD